MTLRVLFVGLNWLHSICAPCPGFHLFPVHIFREKSESSHNASEAFHFLGCSLALSSQIATNTAPAAPPHTHAAVVGPPVVAKLCLELSLAAISCQPSSVAAFDLLVRPIPTFQDHVVARLTGQQSRQFLDNNTGHRRHLSTIYRRRGRPEQAIIDAFPAPRASPAPSDSVSRPSRSFAPALQSRHRRPVWSPECNHSLAFAPFWRTSWACAWVTRNSTASPGSRQEDTDRGQAG
jgi:hypothetical protein